MTPRTAPALALAIAMTACSSRFVASEEGHDADIRVLVAYSDKPMRGYEPVATWGKLPLRFDLADDYTSKIDVWVFDYSMAELVAAFPKLATFTSAEQVAAALHPSLRAPGYDAPSTQRVLHATLAKNGPRNLTYTEEPWANWKKSIADQGRPSLVFALAPEIGCPNATRALRLFNPDRRATPPAGEGTLMVEATRNSTCELALAPSPHLAQLCPKAAGAMFREYPDGSVTLGSEHCSKVPSTTRGLSARWRCGPNVCGPDPTELAIQTSPSWPSSSGTAWAPSTEMRDQIRLGQDFADGGQFAQGEVGALYAFNDARGTHLARFDLVNPGSGDARPIKSSDIPAPQLVSFPGGRTATPMGAGDILRVTSDSNSMRVLIQGKDRAILLSRTGNEAAQYTKVSTISEHLFDLPMARKLAGEMVLNREGDHIFAAVTGGIAAAVIERDVPSLSNATPPGKVTFDAGGTERLTVLRTPAERVFACHHPDGEEDMCTEVLRVFEQNGAFLCSHDFPGHILAMLPGSMTVPPGPPNPRIIFRPAALEAQPFTVAVCTLDPDKDCACNTVEIVVPSSDPMGALTSHIRIGRDAFLGASDREIIGYTIDQSAGMIDLASGLSRALALGPSGSGAKQMPLLFADNHQNQQERKQIWGLVRDPADPSHFDQVYFPALPERP